MANFTTQELTEMMTRLLNTTTTDPAKIEAETKRIDAISWELHNRKGN